MRYRPNVGGYAPGPGAAAFDPWIDREPAIPPYRRVVRGGAGGMAWDNCQHRETRGCLIHTACVRFARKLSTGEV